ncbi:MAG: anti-sigma factor antagonist [Gemmataceae bacterium]|nr:anti-sigma factor antagonist [Gemmataceae bacterium]
METNLEVTGDVTVIELLGDSLDMTNADDVKGQLVYLAIDRPKLVVDLHRVGFVDSAGCGALISVQRRCREAGGDLRICSPRRDVKTVLELARVTRVLGVYATRDQAVAAFGG